MQTVLLLDYNPQVATYFSDEKKFRIIAVGFEPHEVVAFKEVLPASSVVYSAEDVQYNEDFSHFTYDAVKPMRDGQRRAEYGFDRARIPRWERDNVYYSALAFWEKIFNENEIDLVFCIRTEHGSPIESVALVMGRERDIPTYILQNAMYTLWTVVDFNNNKLVPLSDLSVTLDTLLHDNVRLRKTNLAGESKVKSWFRNVLGQLNCEVLTTFFRKKTQYRRVHCFNYPILHMYGELFRMYWAKWVYKRIATTPKAGEKYIYFSLHLEPEATTGARVAISNQIFLIRMLAKALPQGWKVLVKEHPNQFNLNRKGFLLFLPSAMHCKGSRFYKKIKEIEGVELVSLQCSSSEMIANAEAVASITGTCILEALLAKKPNIIFEKDLSIYRDAESCFHVASQAECHEAIKSLQDRQFVAADFDRDLHSICEYCMPRATFPAEQLFSMLKVSG